MLAYKEHHPKAQKVVVLLHGFCENKELWDDFAEHISSEHRFICPDLGGFGQSPLPTRQSIESMAENLKIFLDNLNIHNFTLIGHSLGAYVGLAFAEKHAAMLDGLGLFHSTAFADSDEKKQARLKAIQHIESYGKESYLNSFFPNLFALPNRQRFVHKIHELEKAAQNLSSESLVETLKAMRVRPDRTHILESLDIPVLFIVGKHDAAISLEDSLKQCSIPKKSVVYFLDNAGHSGMFEAKNDCIKILKNFLNYVG